MAKKKWFAVYNPYGEMIAQPMQTELDAWTFAILWGGRGVRPGDTIPAMKRRGFTCKPVDREEAMKNAK